MRLGPLAQRWRGSSLSLLLLIAACSGSATPKVGDYWKYDCTMLVPQLLAKTTQTFTLTVRIEEPETIDGHRWNKTVSVVTGIAGIEPTVEYTRWDGDRVKSMNASQTMQVSRSRDLDIGGSFETLEGGHCDVLDQVDVPLEKATYRDAWQLDCKNPEASSTMYVLDDGSLIRAVVKHKNDVVVEMRLAERGNANAR